MRAPTTAAMVAAAQDAYDVASADCWALAAKVAAATAARDWENMDALVGRYTIALAAADYADAVLRSAQIDSMRSTA